MQLIRQVTLGVSEALSVVFVTVWALSPGTAGAQAPAAGQPGALVGEWMLNKELSDHPPDRPRDGDETGGRRGDGGMGRGGMGPGGGPGGGMGRGGFGGGRGGPGSGPGSSMSPEDRQRTRDAMRDIMRPAERLTIVQTESVVLITTGDGRVTRMAPNGKKIKDDSTKIERRTTWDGDRLVSDITGGPRKVTETYTVDPKRKQLHLTIQMDNPDGPMTVTRVYDASAGG